MTTLREALMLTDGGIVSLVGAGGKTSLMFALAAELARDGDTVLTTTTTNIFSPSPDQSPAVIVAKDLQTVVARSREILERTRLITAAADTSGSPQKLEGFPPEAIESIHRSGLFRWIIVEADGAFRRPLKAPADHEPVIPDSSGWVVGLVGLSAAGKPADEQWVFRLSRFCRLTGLAPGDAISAGAIAKCLAHPSGIMRGAPAEARQIVFLNQADDDKTQARADSVLQCLARAPGRLNRAVIGSMRRRPIVVEYRDFKRGPHDESF